MRLASMLNPSFLKRWHLPLTDRTILLAPVVGVVAGLGAIVFHLMCLVVTHYSLAQAVGYEQGGPSNETEFSEIFALAPHTSFTFNP